MTRTRLSLFYVAGYLTLSGLMFLFAPTLSIKLLGAAEILRERIQSPRVDHEQVEYDQSVARLRAMLAETKFNALWAEGKSMTMEQAIQLALMEQG